MTIILPVGLDLFVFSEYLSIYHKKKYGWGIFLVLIGFISFSMDSFLHQLEGAAFIQVILYIIIFFIISFLFEGNFLSKFFRWTGIVLLSSVLNFVPVLLTYGVEGFNSEIYAAPIFIGGYIFSRILIYFVIIKIKKNKQILYFDISQYKTITIRIILAMCSGIIVYYLLIQSLLQKEMNNTSLILLLFFITSLFLILMNLYQDIYTKANEFIKKITLMTQNKIEYNYATALETKMEDLQKLRHDMRNHISMISYLANENNIEGLKMYLKELQVPLVATSIIHIHNQPELSALINSKYKIAMQNHIKVDIDVDLKNKLAIPLYDLSIIYGNVLDNAIEASLQISEQKREISLYTGMVNDYLIIDCINCFEKRNLQYKKGQYLTSKKDSSLHGKGLKIIEEIVESYDGDVTVEIENNHFKVHITLNNNIPK